MTPRFLLPGTPAWTLVVVALLMASGLGALHTAPHESLIPTWWPPVGLGIALLAMTSRRWWYVLVPTVGVATMLTNVLHEAPLGFSLVFMVLSMLQAVAGALVLRGRRHRRDVQLTTQDDVVHLGVAALCAATIAAAGAALAGLVVDGPDSAFLFRTLFPSHLASTLVILPALLPCRRPRLRHRPHERLLQLGLLILAIGIAFGPDQGLNLVALPLPVLMWAAYRFGLPTVAWQILGATVAISLLTWAGHGPFTQSEGVELGSATIGGLTQAYLICLVALCVPVAIGVHTSDVLQRKLRSSRHLSDMTLSTTACIILVTDMAGTVVRANEAVRTVLGFDPADVVGRPIWETIVPEEHRHLAIPMFDDPDGSGVPATVEAPQRDVHGNEHRVLWNSGVVRDEDGNATHVVMTGLDVTVERQSSGLVENLLGAALDTAIIGLDTRGQVTLFNTGAEKMLGRGAREVIGSPFVEVLAADAFAGWAARLGAEPSFATLVDHLVEAPPSDWEWRSAPRPGAPLRRVSMALSKVSDHNGSLIGYLCVGTDVTDIHATAELLVTALEKERQVVGHLKSLDTAKDQFVSTISHELRTPVSTIVGYSEMLTDGDLGSLSPVQAKALEAITRNGDRLVSLVDNLLALNGLAAEGPTWDRDPVDLREVLRAAETEIDGLVDRRSLAVSFESPDRPVRVVGDVPTLTLALTNLLSNAVKFTPDGGQVRCLLDTEGTEARVLVHDTGMGIPEDEQHRIFERFWRSTTAQRHEIQGTGLGLSTAQTIILAHGGRIEVESNEQRGTTVTVGVPLSDLDGSPRH